MASLVLVHGAVTGPEVWDRVTPLLHAALPGVVVRAPKRPCTGSLAAELDWLVSEVNGLEAPWLVGMSGGATLGLALAATGTRLEGAVLHEPAVGTLAPGLLGPVAAAFEREGVAGFGRALYGSSWTPELGSDTSRATAAAELAMFGSFEPGPARPEAGRVIVTVGGRSPHARHHAATALVPLGYEVHLLPGAHHFVAHDHPELLAETLASVVAKPSGEPRSGLEEP